MTEHVGSEAQKHPGGRRKGAGSTRDAILQAAITLFAERGYEATTLRAITERAGVDVAMVSHFFGNKQGLFDEAVLERGEQNIQMLIDTEPGGKSAKKLLEFYFAMWEDKRTAQTARALFRAALESEANREHLQTLISKRLNKALRMLFREEEQVFSPEISPESIAVRNQLIAAQLLGVGISRYIMQFSPLAEEPIEVLIAQLTPVIEAYLLESPFGTQRKDQ